ncbi:THUMP domain-containing protein 2 isoform X1 [Dipodomys spectabilis]|uniref:THUMP domain-containing protein 2 isoform X1 n=2 Tax=Dipodomys spectabilis TaxID=105255 RepID=UPI001C53F0E8|nr:THUMP domain-containing protein 2 isoform X1 [Dipodomys spectabilis]
MEPGDAGLGTKGPPRFFCTAGRGLEPFLMREVRERLAATQVEYMSGKVFFITCSNLSMIKKLKSAERVFLLIKKQFPLTASSPSKGKILHEMRRLISDDPGSWLNAISLWKSLLETDAQKEKLSQSISNPLKRKVDENEQVISKKLKVEVQKNEEIQQAFPLVKQVEESALEQGDSNAGREHLQEKELEDEVEEAADAPSPAFTFRVSCRCSGTVAKVFTAQEVGKIIGIALMKQFGWKADLRTPDLEIFIHLNDVYSVLGIPLFSLENRIAMRQRMECEVMQGTLLGKICSIFPIKMRVPLASRTYIQMAGLRSTIAWAMASLAEIKAGALVLDPMCGLGTILLEAAKEWPNVYYVGTDVSDSQLLGAQGNVKAANLQDRIELLKVSVVDLPLPSECVDSIISDIPFGKKFKLGKDITSILQEMERVLRVGGTIVLLLSEDHRRCLQDCGESSVPQNSPGNHPANHEGKENTIPSETASSLGEASKQESLDKMPPFGSLVAVECYKVSLGKTDAFICKYKKSQAARCYLPEPHCVQSSLLAS